MHIKCKIDILHLYFLNPLIKQQIFVYSICYSIILFISYKDIRLYKHSQSNDQRS